MSGQTLGIIISAAIVLMFVTLIVLLLRMARRREAEREQRMGAAWTGTIVGFEHGVIRVQRVDPKPLYVEVLIRRNDGETEAIKVPEDRGAGVLVQETLQPLPPPGFYDEVQNQWTEGDRLEKPAGAYYPVRVAR